MFCFYDLEIFSGGVLLANTCDNGGKEGEKGVNASLQCVSGVFTTDGSWSVGSDAFAHLV